MAIISSVLFTKLALFYYCICIGFIILFKCFRGITRSYAVLISIIFSLCPVVLIFAYTIENLNRLPQEHLKTADAIMIGYPLGIIITLMLSLSCNYILKVRQIFYISLMCVLSYPILGELIYKIIVLVSSTSNKSSIITKLMG